MNRDIVVGYDSRDGGRDALALAGVLAPAFDARVVSTAVYEPPGVSRASSAPFEAVMREDALVAVGRAQDEEWMLGDRLETKVVPSQSPARGLHDLAEDSDAALIVVGSSDAGPVGRVLAGRTGEALLHGSPSPVAVAPKGYAGAERRPPKVIDVAFDGSPEAWRALERAVVLARSFGASIRVITVVKPAETVIFGKGDRDHRGEQDAFQRVREEIAKEDLDEALSSLLSEVEPQGKLVTTAAADVASALLDAAGDELELLVVGSRGYGPDRSVLLGSTSKQLIRRAPCPVIVFPRGATTTTSHASGGAEKTEATQ